MQPNDIFLQGFARVRSEKAVFHTHNCGVEPAVHWLMEHSEDADIDTPLNLAVGQRRQQRCAQQVFQMHRFCVLGRGLTSVSLVFCRALPADLSTTRLKQC